MFAEGQHVEILASTSGRYNDQRGVVAGIGQSVIPVTCEDGTIQRFWHEDLRVVDSDA